MEIIIIHTSVVLDRPSVRMAQQKHVKSKTRLMKQKNTKR